MGIHVSVQDREGVDHSDWDFLRHAGDREIPKAVEQAGIELLLIPKFQECLCKPRDLEKFYEYMLRACPDNEERWKQLVELLRDEGNWLHFSF